MCAFYRMAQKVWIKAGEGAPTKVLYKDNDDVDDLIYSALSQLNYKDTNQSLVTLRTEAGGNCLKRGYKVASLLKDYPRCGVEEDTPILLEFPEDNGMYIL